MSDYNTTDSDSNETSDIFSQLTEMKESYEKKISELQTEFSELKGLMMSILKKTDENSPSTSSQGLSKQPRLGLDMGCQRFHHDNTKILLSTFV